MSPINANLKIDKAPPPHLDDHVDDARVFLRAAREGCGEGGEVLREGCDVCDGVNDVMAAEGEVGAGDGAEDGHWGGGG
jgi:hypothetical protein